MIFGDLFVWLAGVDQHDHEAVVMSVSARDRREPR